MAKVIKARGPGPRSLAYYERMPLEEITRNPLGPDGPLTPEAILRQARAEAEELAAEAYADGHRRGVEAGKAEYLERVGRSAEALQSAAAELVRMREVFLESLEPQIVELSLLIAERILQAELADHREVVRRSVRRALEHLVDAAAVTVSVNPADLDALRAEKASLLESFEGIRQLVVRADSEVSPGGCIVDTESVRIDASIESQFARIADELRDLARTAGMEGTREDH